ncbi:MAG: carboxypeptidase regulatory-like domain-containing protein [Planctomicrobium sp.]|jgi:hypothetical protein|nr:carboxypeptidase regulatory-like domain-containing protein [Planctomicrobium sp.]
MIRMTKTLALSCFVLLAQQSYAQDAEVSHDENKIKNGIVGRIVVTGDVPKLPPLLKKGQQTKDQICSDKRIRDKSLLVSEEGGLANAFVYLRQIPKGLETPKAKSESSLTCKKCQFKPYAQIASVGQPFMVTNSNSIAINFKLNAATNAVAATIASPSPRDDNVFSCIFQHPERTPIKVTDDFHGWATAWILPLEHPFAAVTDKDGNFTIQGLPPGSYEFVVWHEKGKNLERKLEIKIQKDKPTQTQLSYPISQFLETVK